MHELYRPYYIVYQKLASNLNKFITVITDKDIAEHFCSTHLTYFYEVAYAPVATSITVNL